MDEIFKTKTVLDKETCKQFGRVSVRKNKIFLILYIIGIILILSYAVKYIFPDVITIFTEFPFLGLFLCIYTAIICVIIPSVTYKNIKKSKRGIEDNLTFFDSYFVSDSNLGTSQMNYSVVEKIFESETAFYLFLNKSSAQIVNKNLLEIGSIDYFRSFISEKTGCQVKFVSSKKRTGQLILSFFAPVILLIASITASYFIHPVDTFSKDNYSIELYSYFYQEDDEYLDNGQLTAFDDGEWYISVSKIAKNDKYSSTEKLLKEKYKTFEIKESSESGDKIKACCKTIYSDIDVNETYDVYQYVSIVCSGDEFYVTEFNCSVSDEYNETDYEQFSQWADTILIKQ